MKVVCLGYIDPKEWDAVPEVEKNQRINECLRYDEVLQNGNYVAGGNCLEGREKAVTLRHQDGRVVVTDGPFVETKEIIGGILELETESFEEAVELMKKHPGVKMGPFEIRGTIKPHPGLADSSDEELIRAVVSEWSKALEAKDVASMMSHYLEDAVLFDCCPPYKVEGRAGIAEVWEKCLPYFPDKYRSEHRDLQIHVDGNCAFVYGLHHFVPEQEGHPCGESWMRVSVGYRKVGGRWKVAHEHVSIPFNPMSGQSWKIKDPDVLDMPDYGAQPCGAGGEK